MGIRWQVFQDCSVGEKMMMNKDRIDCEKALVHGMNPKYNKTKFLT